MSRADSENRGSADLVAIARQIIDANVTAPAQFRLYRATATAHFVLDATDHRLPVALTGDRA